METITDYDYGISYTLGKANIMADALSRKSNCNNPMACKAQPLHDDCNNPMAYKAQPLQGDLTYREHPICVLHQVECCTRPRAINILKVQWSNPFEDEATWELEERLRDEYPALFPSTS